MGLLCRKQNISHRFCVELKADNKIYVGVYFGTHCSSTLLEKSCFYESEFANYEDSLERADYVFEEAVEKVRNYVRTVW